MLLTIHNLPANIQYADIRSLLSTKIGLTDFILDNLVNDGLLKKVTVGLSDEGDAAILVRKINGLYIGGQQLYIEDSRKKRTAAEQPFRTSVPNVNYLVQSGFGMQDVQNNMADPNMIYQQPAMENYDLIAMGEYYTQDPNVHAQQIQNFVPGIVVQPQMGMPQPFNIMQGDWQSRNDIRVNPSNIVGSNRMLTEQNPTFRHSLAGQAQNTNEKPSNNSIFSGNSNRAQDIPPLGYRPNERWSFNNQHQFDSSRSNYEDISHRRDLSPVNKNNYGQLGNNSRGENDQNLQYTAQNFGITNTSSQFEDQQNFDAYERAPNSREFNNHKPRSRFDSPPRTSRDGPNRLDKFGAPYNRDRPGQFSRPDRLDHYSNTIYSERPGGPKRADQFRRPERSDQSIEPEGIGNFSRGDKFNQIREAGKPNQFERFKKPEQFNERSKPNCMFEPGRPGISRGPNKSDQFRGPNRPDVFDGPNRPNQSRDKNRPDQSHGPNRPNLSRGANRPDQSHGSNRSDLSRGANRSDQFRLPNRPDQSHGPNRSDQFHGSGRSGESRWSKRPVEFNTPNKPGQFSGPSKPNLFDESKNRPLQQGSNMPNKFSSGRGDGPVVRPSRSRTRHTYDNRHQPSFKGRPDDKLNMSEQSNHPSHDIQARPKRELDKRPSTMENVDLVAKKARSITELVDSDVKTLEGSHLSKILKRDTTWRGQATSLLTKEIVGNDLRFTDIKKFKQMKIAVRSRLDIILGEDLAPSMQEMIAKYRIRYHKRDDKFLVESVLKQVENESAGNMDITKKASKEDKPIQPTVGSEEPEINVTKESNKKTEKPKTVIPVPQRTVSLNSKTVRLYAEKIEKSGKVHYTLEPVAEQAMDEEIEDIGKIVTEVCSEPKNVGDSVICQHVNRKALSDLKHTLRLAVKRRICNITYNLSVRIFSEPRLPTHAEMCVFMPKHGIVSYKKIKNSYYLARFDSYDNFDRMFTNTAPIGNLKLFIQPCVGIGSASVVKSNKTQSKISFEDDQLEQVDNKLEQGDDKLEQGDDKLEQGDENEQDLYCDDYQPKLGKCEQMAPGDNDQPELGGYQMEVGDDNRPKQVYDDYPKEDDKQDISKSEDESDPECIILEDSDGAKLIDLTLINEDDLEDY